MRKAYIQLVIDSDVRDQHITALQKTHNVTPSHEGDAGLDLYCMRSMVCHSNSKIPLGIAMVIVDTSINRGCTVETPISYMLLARSSTHKKNIIQSNCVGIVDAGYRGELMVPVVVINLHTAVPIDMFERLFQAVPFDGKGVDKVVVIGEGEDLNTMFPSSRGTNGFGSTGKGNDHASD